MTKGYSIASARAKLANIVSQAEAGSDIELTRRGKKVAVVVSVARYARLRGEPIAFTTAYEAFRARHDLPKVGVDRAWARSLRSREPARAVKL